MEDFLCFKCEKCGNKTYLKHALCSSCKGTSFQKVPLEGTGTIITYTPLYATPEGIEEMPLVLGIVEFKDGVRVTGQLSGQNVRTGAKVQPIWGKIRKIQGKDIFGFRFEIVG